jgi:WD40 repeat protein
MVKWNSRLNMVFSASYDDTIKAWRYDETLDDWVCSYTIKGHTSTVWSLDFDSTENFMVSVSDDRSMMIWMVSEKEFKNCGKIETQHSRTVFSVTWSKVGDFIATSGGDNKVVVYEINRESIETCSGEFEYAVVAESKPETGHQMDVNCVVFHPSSNLLASVSDDKSIRFWKFNNE